MSNQLSVVMPCLNEADTLATCIEKAQRVIKEHNLQAEIVIADNGSDDGSIEIAKSLGAKVVHVKEKGYGHALMGGIEAAQGPWVLMGDADDSYDFLEIPKFVEKLKEGFDLVQGCRLPRGGGRVLPGAMPISHRYIGNPMFSQMARSWFSAPIHDVYCGMRAFTKAHYESLEQRCTGMEFATEMIIRSSLRKVKIAEVPITLHPDGRKAHAPHLKTFRDGWRTLRYFLMYAPRWLFMYPGLLLLLMGLGCFGLSIPQMAIGEVHFDAHTMLFGALFLLCGYQSILFSVFTKTFAVNERLIPSPASYNRFYQIMNLERALILAVGAVLLGGGLLGTAIWKWWSVSFGTLNYQETMRLVIPGVTLMAFGYQTVLYGFFTSILGMGKK